MGANNTQYVVTLDETVVETIKDRAKAIKFADSLIAGKKGFKVVVTTTAGKEVHKASRRKITKITPPGTLRIEVPKDVQKIVPKGYVACYERPENRTVVFRNERKDATKATKYAVVSTAAMVLARYAPTTRAAGAIQKALKPTSVTAEAILAEAEAAAAELEMYETV